MIKVPEAISDGFRILREYIDETLKRSAYQNIKLSRIFQRLPLVKNIHEAGQVAGN